MYVEDKYFRIMRKSFPFSCIDVIILDSSDNILLVRRSIPPYKGKWSLPGGIIRYGEKIEAAINRIIKKELGIEINIIKSIGYFEKIYPTRHDISHCFLARTKSQAIKLDFQASSSRFFNKLPNNIAPFHLEMIKNAGFP